MSIRNLLKPLRQLLKVIVALPSLPLVVVIVSLNTIFQRFLSIKIAPIYAARIGHFALEPEIFLAKKLLTKNGQGKLVIVLFAFEQPICNKYLEKHWRSQLTVLPYGLFKSIKIASSIFPKQKDRLFLHRIRHSDNNLLFLEGCPSSLVFTDRDICSGKMMLKKAGLEPDKQFVCISNRDSAYLDKTLPGNWQHHNYRDSSFKYYIPAVEYLIEKGYNVIRMGVHTADASSLTIDGFLDYANSPFRSDFYDLFLLKYCKFFLCGGSGLQSVSALFRAPLVSVNSPYCHTMRYWEGLELVTLPKKYWSVVNDRYLTMSEVLRLGWWDKRDANEHPELLVLHENSPEEIIDSAQEMLDILDGTFQPTDLQKYFAASVPKEYYTGQLNGYITNSFLSKYA